MFARSKKSPPIIWFGGVFRCRAVLGLRCGRFPAGIRVVVVGGTCRLCWWGGFVGVGCRRREVVVVCVGLHPAARLRDASLSGCVGPADWAGGMVGGGLGAVSWGDDTSPSWLGRRSRVRVGWWCGGCWGSGRGLGGVVRWECGGVSGGVLRNVLCRNGYARTLMR